MHERSECKRDSAQPSVISDVLRQGFRIAYHNIGLVLLDLLWKSIWMVATFVGFLVIGVWFGSAFRSLQWIDTGNRATNTAVGFALLKEFWAANRNEIFWISVLVLILSVIAWFVLEAAFRAKIVAKSSPPQLRRGGATGSGLARRGGVDQQIDFLEQHHPSRGLHLGVALPGSRFAASALPSSTEEGSCTFTTFLVSNVLKCFFLANASVATSVICFGRYFATPITQWPELWHDTRGAAVIGVVSIVALGFALTIVDTLVRSDAVELLGTDLFRVAGLITILLSFEAMMVASCAVMLGAGVLNISSLKTALVMASVMALTIALLNVLHSYLLLVRYSVVGIMRQNVIEI